MSQQIHDDLSSAIDEGIVSDMLSTYVDMVGRYQKNDIDGCLAASGKFVENVLRAVEYRRSGQVLSEIKNANQARLVIEKDNSLPESLRILVPRVALSMVYDVRSKTGAVHVKEINPRKIDASLAVHAASWILAEFLRLFHTSDEQKVSSAMESLMRTHTPFIESFDGEVVVTRRVGCELELLLLLANVAGEGMNRTELGEASRYNASAVSRMLPKLTLNRWVHKTSGGRFYITGPGEKRASDLMEALSD